MKVLVTGGAGYLGSTLVPMLLVQGHKVRIVDRLSPGSRGLRVCCTNPNLDVVRADVRDETALSAALANIDVVLHLAAVVGYPACERQPQLANDTNVEGTRTLLRLRKPNQRFVFASTGSVYGSVPGGRCDEDTPPTPITIYGKTKAAAEKLVVEAGNSVCYRYSTAFGVSPHMRFDLMVNDFAYQAVHTGRLVVYQARFRRTFIHVRDVARSLLFAIDNWHDVAGDIYNVGDEAMNLTKADVAHRLRNYVDFDLTFAEVDQDADKRDYEVSFTKLRRKGFKTLEDFDSGLSGLVGMAHFFSLEARNERIAADPKGM